MCDSTDRVAAHTTRTRWRKLWGAAGMSTSGSDLTGRAFAHAPSERLRRHGCPPLRMRHTSVASRPSGSHCSGANGNLPRKLLRPSGNSSSESGRQPRSFFSGGVAGGPAARQWPSESLAKRPPMATPTDPHKTRVTGNRQSTRPTMHKTASPSHGRDPAGPGGPGHGQQIPLQRTCNDQAIIRGITGPAGYAQSINPSVLSAAASAPLHDKNQL